MRERLPLIVINPAAGGGAAGRAWASAAPTVRSHFGPYECAFTRHRGDATRIAEEESRAGRRFIITFGGDGTISEVARGILRSGGSVELGFLPQGTGADFLRTLGAPSRLADAARALRHSRTCTIDVGKISYTTGDNETTSTWFVNSASFGLSGEVAERTNEAQRASKALGGKVAYAAQTLKAALAFTPKAVWIQTGTESARRLTITQVSIANGRFFLRILADGPRLYTGTHLSLPEVDHCQVDSVKAWPDTTEEEVGLELDGETPGRLPAHFEVCPRALTVRVPQ
jgi:diacylglycerol kinase family enzyme